MISNDKYYSPPKHRREIITAPGITCVKIPHIANGLMWYDEIRPEQDIGGGYRAAYSALSDVLVIFTPEKRK